MTSYAHFANRHGERKRKEEQGCEMFAVQMKCQGPSEAEPRHHVDPAYLIRVFNYSTLVSSLNRGN